MSAVKMFDDLALSASIFEIPHHRLVKLFRWPLMDSYVEKHAGRAGSVFKLSLVGIAGGDATSSGSGLNAVHREKAREMIAALYLDIFTGNDEDMVSIKCATANASSFALFISCGTPPPKKKKTKAPVTSIFALRDKKGTPPSLQCIAAVTVTAGKKFQFVHWLGITTKRTNKSKHTSWEKRGLASLLLYFVVKRAALPSVMEPQVVLLQCSLPKPTPIGMTAPFLST